MDKNNSRQAYQLSYDQQKTGEFSLHGTYAKDSLEITLKKVDIHQFPLMRRGFRWIIDHHYYN